MTNSCSLCSDGSGVCFYDIQLLFIQQGTSTRPGDDSRRKEVAQQQAQFAAGGSGAANYQLRSSRGQTSSKPRETATSGRCFAFI